MLKELTENTDKELKDIVKMIYEHNQNVKKEKKNFLRYQTKIPEMVNAIAEMRHSQKVFNSGLEQAEEIVSELEQRSFEMIIF